MLPCTEQHLLTRASSPLASRARLRCTQVSNPVLRQAYDAYSFSVIPLMGELVAQDRASYQVCFVALFFYVVRVCVFWARISPCRVHSCRARAACCRSSLWSVLQQGFAGCSARRYLSLLGGRWASVLGSTSSVCVRFVRSTWWRASASSRMRRRSAA
jgi:hypothetical protein